MRCSFETIGLNLHKCRACGFEINVEQDPSQIYMRCTSDAPREFPLLVEQAKNFIKDAVSYVQSGFENVTQEEYNERMRICAGDEKTIKCEFFQDNRCLKCGCACNFKAWGRAFKCPMNKWPEKS